MYVASPVSCIEKWPSPLSTFAVSTTRPTTVAWVEQSRCYSGCEKRETWSQRYRDVQPMVFHIPDGSGQH